MNKRVLTAVIGLPLLFLIVYLGGWFLTALVFVLSFVAQSEYVNAVRHGGIKINNIFLAIQNLIILVLMKFDFYAVPFGIVVCFMMCVMYEVFSDEPSFLRAVLTLFFLIYVPFLFGFLMMFDNIVYGKYMIWICFLAPFATDTFAYYGGKKFGKRKLTPISPNKTIAGSVCGLIACAVVIFLYGLFLQYYFHIEIHPTFFSLIGLMTSASSQIGDLCASLIKRTYDIKDFGKILPGHGGILDRFDSILFTIPVVYIFTYYLFR